jgi:signal transduction histidine kinase
MGSSGGGSTVEFWVADRGHGIPPGAEERIFERFGRADTGRGIRGSGLGLPIVKTIATAHGGRVSLTTSADGSRFGLVIPILDAPQNEDTEGL